MNEYEVQMWGVPDWQREWWYATYWEEWCASDFRLAGYYLYWRWL
jgi:hypothetical protein